VRVKERGKNRASSSTERGESGVGSGGGGGGGGGLGGGGGVLSNFIFSEDSWRDEKKGASEALSD